jgi:Glycosyl transferase family 11/N-terminal domain of galactosyltransferase
MITFTNLGSVGRLGNHLFQIAAAIGIADKLDTLACFPEWKYERYFKYPLPKGYVSKAESIEEKHFHFDGSLFELNQRENYDLNGYLQTEKYWIRCKKIVLKQFEFEPGFKKSVSEKYTAALTKPTVAISVRRGDFVNNPNYFQLPVTYYLNAYYKYFGSGYNVLIFSDDFDWCKTHFKALPDVYFTYNLNDIEQLCLMSLCDNHIISNSTFSWWGAYLSQSKNVIRPEKNFAGKLAKENSEKDYWPGAWKMFNDYRIDLSDTTFIIPVHYDHPDRMQNMMLTLAFLNTNFKTNIFIGEQGGNAFDPLKDYAEYYSFNYPDFHRTKIINQLAKMADTPVIVNWDCDNICAPAQLAEAVQKIRQGIDIAYPFDGTVHRTPRFCLKYVANSLDVHNISDKYCNEKQSSVGHAVVMNKESFIKAGMENENFISWGPEDSERFNRYNILGLNVQRIEGPIYHIDHFIGENSSHKNKYFKANEREFLKIATRNKEQLEEMIKGWAWVN